jgi:excisionase family DNA binding protein
MAGEQWLTVEQVAQRLQVHAETVRRWLRAGRLKGLRLGGTKLGYRISERELTRFLEREGTGEGERNGAGEGDQGKAKAA